MGTPLRTSRDKNRAVSEYVAHENVDVILQKTLDLLRFVTVHQTHSETQTLAVSTTCPEYNSGFLGKGSASSAYSEGAADTSGRICAVLLWR